jgi:flagellar FliJ protein
MKKFAFNLETLLRHRNNLEEKERNELSRITFVYQTEVNRREEIRKRLKETSMELAQLRREKADSEEIAWFYPYIDRLRHEIGESDKRIAQLQQDLQAQKLVVIEAIKKKRVLDSLKTRKRREYNLAVERQEQKTVDELVITRFARKDG